MRWRPTCPDPRIGTWQVLDAVRAKLHERGVALFLDFVGNHTALDHPWIRRHPEFYVNGTAEDYQRDPASFCRVETPRRVFYLALGRDPYFPPWPDVAQLNHFSEQMRAAQLADLRAIAAHCDGVRCDMAMLHLNDIFERIWGHLLRGTTAPGQEFWEKAHTSVPELILLAEAYWGTESRLLDLGFSYVYDKGLYDAVRDRNMADVRGRLAVPAGVSDSARAVSGESRRGTLLPRFSHRPGAGFGGVADGYAAGHAFYHQGELEGASVHLPITLRMAGDEAADPAATAFFAKLLRITKDADLSRRREWNLLPVTDEGSDTAGNLVVYEWRSEKAWKLIAINLAGGSSQGRVHFGDRDWPAAGVCVL